MCLVDATDTREVSLVEATNARGRRCRVEVTGTRGTEVPRGGNKRPGWVPPGDNRRKEGEVCLVEATDARGREVLGGGNRHPGKGCAS